MKRVLSIQYKMKSAEKEALSVKILREESDLLALREASTIDRSQRSLHSLHATTAHLTNWDDTQHTPPPASRLIVPSEPRFQVVIRPKSAKDSQRKLGFSWFSFRTAKKERPGESPYKSNSTKAFLKAKSGLYTRNRTETTSKEPSHNSPQVTNWFLPQQEVFSYLVKLRTMLRPKSPVSVRRGSKEMLGNKEVISFAKLDLKPLNGSSRMRNGTSTPKPGRTSETLIETRRKRRQILQMS